MDCLQIRRWRRPEKNGTSPSAVMLFFLRIQSIRTSNTRGYCLINWFVQPATSCCSLSSGSPVQFWHDSDFVMEVQVSIQDTRFFVSSN